MKAPVGRVERSLTVGEAERFRTDILVVGIERFFPVDPLNSLLQIGAVLRLPGLEVAMIGNGAKGMITVHPFGPDPFIQDEVAGDERPSPSGPVAAEPAQEAIPFEMSSIQRSSA